MNKSSDYLDTCAAKITSHRTLYIGSDRAWINKIHTLCPRTLIKKQHWYQLASEVRNERKFDSVIVTAMPAGSTVWSMLKGFEPQEVLIRTPNTLDWHLTTNDVTDYFRNIRDRMLTNHSFRRIRLNENYSLVRIYKSCCY